MAYLQEITVKCQVCSARAMVRLRDRFNGHRGDFCRRHGQQRFKELEREERAEAERAR